MYPSVPVADGVQDGFPIAQLTIKDTNPIWVYCAQANHCQSGMVMAINGADKFQQFKDAATGNATQASSSAAPASSTAASSSAVAPSQSAPGTTTVASSTTTASPSTPTSADHRVIVGGSSLTFQPSNITASPGDTITFEFHSKNHTVTESTFSQPCAALTSPNGQIGFDSGL